MAPYSNLVIGLVTKMKLRECVENSWMREKFARAANSRDQSGRFKSQNCQTKMDSRFKNRLSNGKFGKPSQINTSLCKERLLKGLNSWRKRTTAEFEPTLKAPRLINTRTVMVHVRKTLCV